MSGKELITKIKNYIVEINDLNHEGQGVGRIENFTVFVEGTVIGEKVEVKIIKVAKNYAVGQIEKIIRHSKSRVEPFCSNFKRCGGCSIQHIDYNHS